MHIAGKIFLGLGVLMLVGGGIMAYGGGSSLDNAVDWDVEEKSEFEGPVGEWYHDESDWMIIFVTDDVDCESFSLTYTDENGSTGYDHDGDGIEDESYFAKEECGDDGMSLSQGDDPDGFYSVGSFMGKKGTYQVEGSHGFYTVPAFEVIGEVAVGAVGGIMGIIGGIGIFGCGVCSLVLGGILALVLKEPQPPTQMQ